ncbi:MAG: tripartite tricarboxylate transporter permease [Gammaproteobacteria bacterium]|nr:tripartite tricarboxylate transporter permease [Gammaproteobacteria bacterium]
MPAELTQAIAQVFTLHVIGYVTFGVFIGYLVGALPGMNRATAIALLIPFTFGMSPLAAISFLIGLNKGGAAGCAVSAILINVPGEPSAVVTTLDGYPLTRQGRSQKALKVALYASVLGDLGATVVLIVLAAPLARLAVGTGPVELTAVMLFAITFIAAVSGRSFYKGVISGFLGLLLAAPRLDLETGLPRLTFGFVDLFDGIPLLAVAIGTLALSEVLVQIDRGWRAEYGHKMQYMQPASDADRRLSWSEFWSCLPTIIRSTGVGVLIGLLPGLGASLSSFLSYAWTKRRAADPERFGRGAIEGVAASESADNASVPASLIPVFAIGLPGSVSTALLMGAFMLHGLTPGPNLLRDDSVLVYGIFVGMLLASGILLLVGSIGQRFFSRVILVSDAILLPVIVFLCVIGAYLEGGGLFGVYLMLVFAFVGYFMKKYDYSFVTFLIGFILGPMAELAMRQAMIITDARVASLLDHPVAIVFLVLAVLSVWKFGSIHLVTEAPVRPSSYDESASDNASNSERSTR